MLAALAEAGALAVVTLQASAGPSRLAKVYAGVKGPTNSQRRDRVVRATALKRRGRHDGRLVISDQHSGLLKALKRSFQGAGQKAPTYRVGPSPGPLSLGPPGSPTLISKASHAFGVQPGTDRAVQISGCAPPSVARRGVVCR